MPHRILITALLCSLAFAPACPGGDDDDDATGDDDASADDDATADDDDDATADDDDATADDDDATADDDDATGDDDTTGDDLEACGAGGTCSDPAWDCLQLLTAFGYSEATSYCYLDCAADASVCDDTPFATECVPTSPTVDHHCLGEITVIGDFDTLIDQGATAGNSSLFVRISEEQPVELTDCHTEQHLAPDLYSLHCSSAPMANGYIRHLDLDWNAADHQTGPAFASYSGFLVDQHYSGPQLDEMWSRGLLWFTPGITLTAAGTAAGDALTGSLAMTGQRYDAEFALAP